MSILLLLLGVSGLIWFIPCVTSGNNNFIVSISLIVSLLAIIVSINLFLFRKWARKAGLVLSGVSLAVCIGLSILFYLIDVGMAEGSKANPWDIGKAIRYYFESIASFPHFGPDTSVNILGPILAVIFIILLRSKEQFK